jgi:acyl-CoA synthetase (AMP-forming)/AMP-acid ligase II
VWTPSGYPIPRRLSRLGLARHKVPRDVEFVDQLLRTSTGKLLKRELVERSNSGR